MKAEQFQTRIEKVCDWSVRLTSYRLGEKWICIADNVDPGATIARSEGLTRDVAEREALSKASHMLTKTRIFT